MKIDRIHRPRYTHYGGIEETREGTKEQTRNSKAQKTKPKSRVDYVITTLV